MLQHLSAKTISCHRRQYSSGEKNEMKRWVSLYIFAPSAHTVAHIFCFFTHIARNIDCNAHDSEGAVCCVNHAHHSLSCFKNLRVLKIWSIFTIWNLFTYLPGWTAIPEATWYQWQKYLQMLQEGSGGSDRRQWEPLESKGGSQEKEGMTRKSSKTNVPQRRRPSGNWRPNQCCLQKQLQMRNYY